MAGDLIPNAVVVEYEGPAAITDATRARLGDRDCGVAGMLWEALDRAGWVGELITIRATVGLRVAVKPVPTPRHTPARPVSPPPRGGRRFIEGGWVDDAGVVWQQYVGPLRAAGPGFRLSDAHGPELQIGDDLLRAAAVLAGWSGSGPDDSAEIPEIRVAVAVARRHPAWEAYASDPEAVPWPAPSSTGGGESPGDGEAVGRRDERGLLARARELAARAGDPDPILIQHAYGTRFDLTRTTGSVVFSDAPSCIVVMEGNFRTRGPQPPLRSFDAADGEPLIYPFQILVFDLATGAVTDSGSSHQRPDLRPLGDVVTDHDARR